MIIIKIQGGLGNQIFQYAFGKNLSLKYNIPLYLDLSFFDSQTKRAFELDKFKYISYNTINNISEIPNLNYINDNFFFKEIKLKKNTNYFFDGYWQSDKYIKSIRKKIIEELRPAPNHILEINSKYGEILSKNTVSLHIRRTDYLTSNDYHPVQPLSYYENSLTFIKENTKNNLYHLLIFSDDIHWCKENLNFKNVTFVENNDNITDFYLMSMCKHNIIANSSFSWWSAWLNYFQKNRFQLLFSKKHIIAPHIWFGEISGIPSDDIVPKQWTKLH